ncbi:MAG: M1 family peptidase, partial [Chloroflexales bacterium]|nr:M1 family peptidase [Chloroflexales bacterium]
RSRERFVSGPQRDFMMTAMNGLDQASGEADGTRIVSYYQPGNAAAGARALEAAQQAIRIFNQRFGRYPLAELEVVQAALTNFYGVEYPGIVLIEQRLYKGTSGLATTVAHEVAHQWWYGQVGNDAQRNPWLDEGLASYSQIVYREGIGDIEGANNELQGFRTSYARARQQGRDGVAQRPAAQFSGNYVALVYAKPALFLQALRNRIDDEAFFKGIQSYYAANRYSDSASGDRLVEAMDAACGCATRDLYEAWVLGSGPVEVP